MIYAENILICIAAPLIISLLFTNGNVRIFIGSILTGMTDCLLCAYINGFIDITSGLGAEQTAVYYSPIVEEFVKLLPLLFLLAVFEPDSDTLFLSALGIGSGFATFENCCYLLTSGSSSFSYVLIRGMAVGVMHIVSIMMLALGLEIAKRLRLLSFQTVVCALSFSITFHAIYNLLVSEEGITSYIGYILPTVAAIILNILLSSMRQTNERSSTDKLP